MANYNLYDTNVIIPTFNNTNNTEKINIAITSIKNTQGSCIILNLILTEDFKAQPISQTSLVTKHYDTTNTMFIKVLSDNKTIHILLTRAFLKGILSDTPNNFTDPDIISKIESSNNDTLQQNHTDAHISYATVRRPRVPRGSIQLLPTHHNTSYTHTYNHPFSLQ